MPERLVLQAKVDSPLLTGLSGWLLMICRFMWGIGAFEGWTGRYTGKYTRLRFLFHVQ